MNKIYHLKIKNYQNLQKGKKTYHPCDPKIQAQNPPKELINQPTPLTTHSATITKNLLSETVFLLNSKVRHKETYHPAEKEQSKFE